MTLLLQDTLVISPATVDRIEQEIEDLRGATDCADVVQDKAALDAYDTSKLTDNSIVKVLQDESRNDAETYYRYSKSSDSFTFIGELGPYYTKSENDVLLGGKVDKVTTTSRVYGTDTQGNQTTYDKNDFGKVDDVKVDNVSIVTNKIANIDLTGKVDKSNTASQVYATDENGTQTTLKYDVQAGYNTIVQRTAGGQVIVNQTPASNIHATSKKYVDDADALKQDKPTITTSTGTTLSVTLADNTIFNNTNAGLTTLTITNPTTPTADFASQINFTSGSTATVVNASNIVWMGDNVSEIAGFVPRTNCRYTIDFVYDGSNIRGYIQGVSL